MGKQQKVENLPEKARNLQNLEVHQKGVKEESISSNLKGWKVGQTEPTSGETCPKFG